MSDYDGLPDLEPCAHCGHDRLDHDPQVVDDEVIDGQCRDGWEPVSTFEAKNDERLRLQIQAASSMDELRSTLLDILNERESTPIQMTHVNHHGGGCQYSRFLEQNDPPDT